MSQIPLVERMEFVPTKLLTENRDGSGRLRVQGVFQKVGKPNKNKRKYNESLWKQVLSEGSDFRRRLASGGIGGQLEHPESGVSTLPQISHKIVSCNRSGEDIVGEAIVLNTPSGKILKELFAVGFPVGISSRGRGETRKDGDFDVVEDSFVLETFDFVYDPSVEEARPKPVSESSVPTQESIVMDKAKAARRLGEAKEKLRGLSESLPKIKTIKGHLEATEELRSLAVGLDEIKDVPDLAEAVGEIQGRVDTLIREAVRATVTLSEDHQYKPEPSGQKPLDKGKGVGLGRDPKKHKNDTAESFGRGEDEDEEEEDEEEDDMGERTRRSYESRINRSAQVEASLRRQVDTAVGIIEELRDRHLKLMEDHKKSGQRLEAALRLTKHVVSEHNARGVLDAVESAVRRNPRLKNVEERLRRCKTAKQVTSVVENLINPLLGGSKSSSTRDGAIPPLNSSANKGGKGAINESAAVVAETSAEGSRPKAVVPAMMRGVSKS